jgi:hypothetical protein
MYRTCRRADRLFRRAMQMYNGGNSKNAENAFSAPAEALFRKRNFRSPERFQSDEAAPVSRRKPQRMLRTLPVQSRA